MTGARVGLSRQVRRPAPWSRATLVSAACGVTRGLIAHGLQVERPSAYDRPMDTVTLPPELERFAAEAVAAGRYRDLSEVVAAGVSLLQRQEQARAELLASVLAAKEESDREGYLTGDEVAARVRATIARKANATA